MNPSKKFIHDRIVLLLISMDVFVAILAASLVLLRLDPNRQTSYIVEYRSNLGLNALKAGGSATFISFIIFAVFTVIFNIVLSAKVYHVRRHFSVAILAITLLLLVAALIVSNALLISQ